MNMYYYAGKKKRPKVSKDNIDPGFELISSPYVLGFDALGYGKRFKYAIGPFRTERGARFFVNNYNTVSGVDAAEIAAERAYEYNE